MYGKFKLNIASSRWREENVESSHFHTNKDIDKLIADTESTVTSDLEGGDRYVEVIICLLTHKLLFLWWVKLRPYDIFYTFIFI